MKLNFDENGLVPLIVQDAESKQVLSLFYASPASLQKMKKTGFVWRYSRSQQKIMKKGATSGNVQRIAAILPDCDSDTLLVLVKQSGKGACHTGAWSCFGEEKARNWGVLDELGNVLAERKRKPRTGSYTSELFAQPTKIGEKLKGEAAELEEAMLGKPDSEVVWEAADLLFFTLVALQQRGIDVERVLQELKRRRK